MVLKRIGKVFEANKNQNDSFDFLTLIKNWDEIIGPRMSKHTIPLKNTYSTLTILTDHPTYSQQLHFMETQIIEKITNHFPNLKGKINKIKYVVNPVFFKTKVDVREKFKPKKVSQQSLRYSPQYKAARSKAEQEIPEIEDEEVREFFISLHIQNSKPSED